MEEKRGNRQILAITYIFVAIFLGMAAYLVNFIVKDSDTVINNPYNKRQKLLAERVVRGEIYSADGKVLAKTETLDGGEEKRVYPYGDIFCHAVGRTANSMTGVELAQCYPLLTSHANPFLQLTNTFRGEKNPGDNVYTTLDSNYRKRHIMRLESIRVQLLPLSLLRERYLQWYQNLITIQIL